MYVIYLSFISRHKVPFLVFPFLLRLSPKTLYVKYNFVQDFNVKKTLKCDVSSFTILSEVSQIVQLLPLSAKNTTWTFLLSENIYISRISPTDGLGSSPTIKRGSLYQLPLPHSITNNSAYSMCRVEEM